MGSFTHLPQDGQCHLTTIAHGSWHELDEVAHGLFPIASEADGAVIYVGITGQLHIRNMIERNVVIGKPVTDVFAVSSDSEDDNRVTCRLEVLDSTHGTREGKAHPHPWLRIEIIVQGAVKIDCDGSQLFIPRSNEWCVSYRFSGIVYNSVESGCLMEYACLFRP